MSHEISYEILMKYHTLFFRKLGNMLQNVSSAAVVIGALRVKAHTSNAMYQAFKVKGHWFEKPKGIDIQFWHVS